jgi:hypothetical protein
LVANAYTRARIELPSAPRAYGSLVDQSGNFQVFAEPGTYDFFVRPAASSGFAWLVVPGLDFTLPNRDFTFERPLLPPPVRLDLQVSLAGKIDSTTLAGAQVRVFALLGEEGALVALPELARSAVPIAQGRLSSSGFAALMLPQTLKPQGVQ